MRRGHLKERASDAAYTVYVVALALVIYGGGLYSKLTHLAAQAAGHTAQGRVLDAAGPALVALHLLALLAMARDALWRGPVTVPAPAVAWLMPLPIDRARLLRPRYRISAVAAGLLGAAVGAIEALVLAAASARTVTLWLPAAVGRGVHLAPLVAVLAGSGALLGLLGTGLAGLIARYARAATAVRRATPVVVTAGLGLAVVAWLAATGHHVAAVATVALWSGPWGWAAQPALAAVGRAPAGWPAAVTVLAALALAAVVAADRRVAGIGTDALRARAQALTGLAGATLSLDARAAALTIRSARGGRWRHRWRLPRPRRSWLAVPWRDATALLRTPSRLAWSALLGAVAGLLASAAAGLARGIGAIAMVAGALAAGYLAATQLTEPARVEADDPRRAAGLPYRFSRLALWHAVIPTLVVVVLGLAAATVTVSLTGSTAGLALVLAAGPALVAAALVSAYRGPVPGFLLLGAETPAGNTAPVQIIGWYAAGPLVAIVLLTPPLATLVLGHPHTATWVWSILWGNAVAAVLLMWVTRRSAARLRD